MKLVRTLAPVVFLHATSAFAQQRITGTVYDSLGARAPLANATVVLIERARYVTTDARGRFRIDSVPAGSYTLGFMHAVLDSLGLVAPVTRVDVTAGRSTRVTLVTPAPAATYALLCPGPQDIETGAVLGRVRDVDDDSPLPGAVISTVWTEFTLSAGRVNGQRARASAQTNAAGVYILCGVPKAVNLVVYSDFDGAIAGPSPLSIDERLIGRRDFAISGRDSAARKAAPDDSIRASADSARSPVSALPGTASLRGVVRDGQGKPLAEALVGVMGTPRSARTDAEGAFRIAGIPAGTRAVEARSIGLVPLTVSMDFATNAARETVLLLDRQAQYLRPVTVLGRRYDISDATGFESRRRQAGGQFVSAADIAKHPSFDLLDVLARISGVRIEYRTAGRPSPLMRGDGMRFCQPNYYLNGVYYHIDADWPFEDLSAFVPPDRIRGVEVYSGSGIIPPRFDRSAPTRCGSIVIWMK